MGSVINIQRYSVGDGPGVRTTVFLKGCPLRCLWCSNPESQELLPSIGWRQTLCLHCGHCAQTCPEGAIAVSAERVAIDYRKCIHCGICADNCPSKALVRYGTEMSVEQVIAEVSKDEFFYGSEGGMTLSGGEPLAQKDFALELLKAAKEKGYNTCIETTGFGPLEELLPALDLVLFDIKAVDSELHKKLTGVGNEIILQSLKKAASSSVKIIIRFPFIPGYNTSDEQVQQIIGLMCSLGLREIHIMPYHEYGRAKYEALSREYVVKASKPTTEILQHAVEMFTSNGILCRISEK